VRRVLRSAKEKRLAEVPPLPFEVDDVTYLYDYGALGGEG
jgi:hypothetical protein